MPLEIKELHIRVTVNQPQPEGNDTSAAGSNKTTNDSAALIQQCVDQIMDIINSKKER